MYLNELGSNDTNKAGVRAISDGTSTQSLPCAGRSEEKDSFWGFNTEVHKLFRLKIKQRITVIEIFQKESN